MLDLKKKLDSTNLTISKLEKKNKRFRTISNKSK